MIERPRWVAIMLLTFLVTAGCGVAFTQTAVGRQALVDQWERTALAFGREVGDDRYGRFVAMSEHGGAYALMSAAASGPVLSVVMAGVIRGVFGRAKMLDANTRRAPAPAVRYDQVLAVVAHAGVILALRQLVAAPINYVRETMASPATLGHLFPMFDEASPPARFLGAIDLFVIWWLIVLGVGVAVLYRRSTRGTIATFMGAYVAFAALLAIAMVVTGGTV